MKKKSIKIYDKIMKELLKIKERSIAIKIESLLTDYSLELSKETFKEKLK